MTLIFAARAYQDYGSDYEIEKLKLIKEKFNEEIIPLPIIDESSNLIKFGKGLLDKEVTNFFPLIDKCDIFISIPIWNNTNKDGSKRSDRGNLTEGVKFETLYALSRNKKVYKIDGDKITQINISDSEELILELMILNKRNQLDEKMKELIKQEKRLNIHSKIIDLYERNDNVINLMKSFLSCKKEDAIKPIAIQPRYPLLKELNLPIRYYPYGTKTLYRITDLNMKDLKTTVGQMHFYECFFDDKVRDNKLIKQEFTDKMIKWINDGNKKEDFKPWMVFNDHVIGISIVFDIDCGSNLFEKDTFNKAMILKNGTEEELDSHGLKHKSSTTGNGINVISEPYFFKENDDNLKNCSNEIVKTYEKINNLYHKYIDGVKIDPKRPDWQIYKKMPFTYHAKWNRITLPISDGSNIDREWLMKISDIDYFMNNEKTNIKDVIEKSGWNNNNWW